MRIKKTSQTTPTQAQVVNAQSNSTTDSYSCNYVNEAVKEVYSTDEQVIGTWIDGKPLYRKTITKTIEKQVIESSYNLTDIANNLDYVWLDLGKSFFYQKGTNDTGNKTFMAIGHYGSSTDWSRCFIGTYINVHFGTAYNNYKRYLTLTFNYTKTTDTGNT